MTAWLVLGWLIPVVLVAVAGARFARRFQAIARQLEENPEALAQAVRVAVEQAQSPGEGEKPDVTVAVETVVGHAWGRKALRDRQSREPQHPMGRPSALGPGRGSSRGRVLAIVAVAALTALGLWLAA